MVQSRYSLVIVIHEDQSVISNIHSAACEKVPDSVSCQMKKWKKKS